jgi:xylan 1,4-beta-xylosidase
VFEENGVRSRPFDGGFGLMAAGGIKKPSYNAYKLLHLLGTERLANPANAIVTRRKDGTLVVALWNLVEMDRVKEGKPRLQTVRFTGVDPKAKVSVLRLDADHGNTEGAYKRMGSPQYPTRAQVEQINRDGEIAPAEQKNLISGEVTFEIPVNGLLILELKK